MATTYVYEPQYVMPGWFDDGYRLLGWFDDDLKGTEDELVKLDIIEPVFFDNPNTIFFLDGSPGTPFPAPPVGPPNMPTGFTPTAGIWVWLMTDFFDDPDLIFVPMSIRALVPSDQMLKNEVRRIR